MRKAESEGKREGEKEAGTVREKGTGRRRQAETGKWHGQRKRRRKCSEVATEGYTARMEGWEQELEGK